MDQLRAAVFAALLAGRDPETLLPDPDLDSATDTGAPSAPGPRPAPAAAETASAGRAAAGPARQAGPAGLAALTGSVHLTMPVSAWLELSDAPGEVAALGPLDAWTCRELAARLAAGPGTRWCVTLTSPDGRPSPTPALVARPADRLASRPAHPARPARRADLDARGWPA